mmetsp:Transcript_110927/g.155729  ORF Transcript_110927/g.155729 Transcript_110927/m.155729 type:complete len:249 (+) Transcript_110927:1073-1819(+)
MTPNVNSQQTVHLLEGFDDERPRNRNGSATDHPGDHLWSGQVTMPTNHVNLFGLSLHACADVLDGEASVTYNTYSGIFQLVVVDAIVRAMGDVATKILPTRPFQVNRIVEHTWAGHQRRALQGFRGIFGSDAQLNMPAGKEVTLHFDLLERRVELGLVLQAVLLCTSHAHVQDAVTRRPGLLILVCMYFGVQILRNISSLLCLQLGGFIGHIPPGRPTKGIVTLQDNEVFAVLPEKVHGRHEAAHATT